MTASLSAWAWLRPGGPAMALVMAAPRGLEGRTRNAGPVGVWRYTRITNRLFRGAPPHNPEPLP